jgi:hypothetical protein
MLPPQAGRALSAAWIVFSLVVIAGLYGLLFATARSLHVAEEARHGRAAAQAEAQEPRVR